METLLFKDLLELLEQRTEKEMTTIVVQEWEERERGWSPSWDGYSLHLSSADRNQFVKDYWKSMPDKVMGRAPEIYSTPVGDPYLYDIEFDEELIQKIRETDNGLRTWERVLGE
jgi:hypothetical protein